MDIFGKVNCSRSKWGLAGSAPNVRHGRTLSLQMPKHWVLRPGLERVGSRQFAFVWKRDLSAVPAAAHGQRENGSGGGTFRKWQVVTAWWPAGERHARGLML